MSQGNPSTETQKQCSMAVMHIFILLSDHFNKVPKLMHFIILNGQLFSYFLGSAALN